MLFQQKIAGPKFTVDDNPGRECGNGKLTHNDSTKIAENFEIGIYPLYVLLILFET